MTCAQKLGVSEKDLICALRIVIGIGKGSCGYLMIGRKTRMIKTGAAIAARAVGAAIVARAARAVGAVIVARVGRAVGAAIVARAARAQKAAKAATPRAAIARVGKNQPAKTMEEVPRTRALRDKHKGLLRDLRPGPMASARRTGLVLGLLCPYSASLKENRDQTVFYVYNSKPTNNYVESLLP